MFCKDYNSFFRDLLKEDESVYIHYRNVQILAIILFKGKENLSNTIMSDFFFCQCYEIWFKDIKVVCFESLEPETYRN